MTQIGLLSDTHGYIDDKILNFFSSVDEIWHVGDIGNLEVCKVLQAHKPLRAVYGNIDGQEIRLEYPKVQSFRCEEVEVFMTHIAGYPGKYNPEIRKIIQTKSPKLLVCGHSHILKVMYDKKLELMHMNPGAAGISGFHQVRTVIRFTIEGSEFKNLEVLEIDRK